MTALHETPQFSRAEKLEVRLKNEGIKGDQLSRYRKWLDAKGVEAERDGWPTEEVYDEANIQGFLKDTLWKA